MNQLNNSNKNLLFDRVLQYDIGFMIIFCIVGLFVKYFFTEVPSKDGSSGPATSAIWGYSLIALSMLVIIFISVGLVQKLSAIGNSSIFSFCKNLISKSLPPVVLIMLLLWAIFLNIKYSKTINKDVIPYEYTVADTMLSVMVFIQIIIIMKYVHSMITDIRINPTDRDTGIEYKNSGMMGILTYVSIFIGFISSLLLTMMNIILAFFITDG